MGIHLSSGETNVRRVVLRCDAPGCEVQVEPPPAERWRSDDDARSFARDQAVGWTCDLVAQTDYCPQHAELNGTPAVGAVAPRPTATVRDHAGDPLNRDEYARYLRSLLADDGPTDGNRKATAAQVWVAARLLDELAGVYRGESLGAVAQELAVMLDSPGE